MAEQESGELGRALDDFARAGSALISSSLALIEVSRMLRRRLEGHDPRAITLSVEAALAGVMMHPMDAQTIDVARRLGPATLRSLDATHLASATLVGADVICAYDQRLLAAAAELGFRTVSPGSDGLSEGSA